MSFETYDVYFSGKLIKGQDPEVVQQKIGALFKLEGPGLQRLFSGEAIAIKKGVDMDQAIKYRVTFRDAGALVDIRPAGATQTPATSPASNASPPDVASMTLSPPNRFDLSDCAVPLQPQPIPDISRLNLDSPGIILDNSPPPPPLEIDTGALKLDKPGVILDASPPPPALQIDTGDLQLNPPNQGSLEEFQPAVEKVMLPNIDHLDLVARAVPEEKPNSED
ncbi:MAG: hypothetical protein QNJ78_02635 [Gammaproteobacteria bacterium]|nr:hypothetical protein [Gammaproteobacteria bacterium]